MSRCRGEDLFMKRLVQCLSAILLLCFLVACGANFEQETTSWADRYGQLLASGEGSNGSEFDALQADLVSIRQELGDAYVYVISPIRDGQAVIDGDGAGDFMLTIDGSESSEDWGVIYDPEPQFMEAWSGQVTAARSAWDDETKHRWSVFAPIRHQDGRIVALLGIDADVTDLIKTYPEWSRDNKEWNGYTRQLPDGFPAPIQETLEQLKTQVADYARQLSGQTGSSD